MRDDQDNRADFTPLRKFASKVRGPMGFTRRQKTCGIEVSCSNGDSAAMKRLMEHVEAERLKREAPKSDYQI
jgi:hypothetical protein